MATAADHGTAAETWLRLSAADGAEQAAARALLALLRVSASGVDLPPDVGHAVRRWQSTIEAEVGDPVHADVVRLVGDGLYLEALLGHSPALQRVEALIAHLLSHTTGSRGKASL
jgi:hypothetical protein